MKYIIFDSIDGAHPRLYDREEAFALARALQASKPHWPLYVAPLQYMFVTEPVQSMLEGDVPGPHAANIVEMKGRRR